MQIGLLGIDAAGEQVLRRGQARVVPALVGDLMLGDQRVIVQRGYNSDWPEAAAPAGAAAGDASAPDR